MKSSNVERARRAKEYLASNPSALNHLLPGPGEASPTQVQADLTILGLTAEDLIEAGAAASPQLPLGEREVVAEPPTQKYKTRAAKAEKEKSATGDDGQE